MRKERAGDSDRFVFGISGHRDLVPADLPDLRQQLREIFSRAISRRPNTAFELLTPLAEGADRIAAQEALALGIRLVVPLPMPQAEYERDFVTPGSLAEFRQLLDAADSHFELANAPALSEGDSRAQQYAAVGDYIARKSDVLIFLWDGKDNQKIGGTAWVRKRREHWAGLVHGEGKAHDFETVHVVTRRENATPR